MASIGHTPRAETYVKLRETADRFGEKNDCSVIAVAAVTGLDYEICHAMLENRGRKRGRGASVGAIKDAIKAAGFSVEPVNPLQFINQYPHPHNNLQNVTTHHPDRFPGVFKKGKRYLLFTKSHVTAVVDGVNVDWTRGKAKRAVWIYEVEEI